MLGTVHLHYWDIICRGKVGPYTKDICKQQLPRLHNEHMNRSRKTTAKKVRGHERSRQNDKGRSSGVRGKEREGKKLTDGKKDFIF